MIAKNNKAKTVFKTRDTVYNYYPDSYGGMESSYNNERDSVETAEQMLMEMAFMDKRAFDKTEDNGWASDPLRFVHSNFDELMEQYNDSIFRMLDAKLSLECAEASGDKYNYFGEDVPERTLAIEGYKVSSLQDIEALRVLMRNEEHDIKWELRALCAANPEQITPSGLEPLSYVKTRLVNIFKKLRSTNMMLLKLMLMEDEMLYGFDEAGLTDEEKEKRYFLEKVDVLEADDNAKGSMYVQVKPLTDEEYRKRLKNLTKQELIEMYIAQSRAMTSLSNKLVPVTDDDLGTTTSATTIMANSEKLSNKDKNE